MQFKAHQKLKIYIYLSSLRDISQKIALMIRPLALNLQFRLSRTANFTARKPNSQFQDDTKWSACFNQIGKGGGKLKMHIRFCGNRGMHPAITIR